MWCSGRKDEDVKPSVEEAEEPERDLVTDSDFHVIVHHVGIGDVLDLPEALALPPPTSNRDDSSTMKSPFAGTISILRAFRTVGGVTPSTAGKSTDSTVFTTSVSRSVKCRGLFL